MFLQASRADKFSVVYLTFKIFFCQWCVALIDWQAYLRIYRSCGKDIYERVLLCKRMLTWSGRECEWLAALVAFILLFILAMFSFRVFIKRSFIFKRFWAMVTLPARFPFRFMNVSYMLSQVHGAQKCHVAFITWMFLFTVTMFVFLVDGKSSIVFERHFAIRAFLAGSRYMCVFYMLSQAPGCLKCLAASLAFIFPFMITVCVFIVYIKRFLVFERVFAILIFLAGFRCMHVSCMLFQVSGELKCLAALIVLVLFLSCTGNTHFRYTCHLDAEITDRSVFGAATTDLGVIWRVLCLAPLRFRDIHILEYHTCGSYEKCKTWWFRSCAWCWHTQ